MRSVVFMLLIILSSGITRGQDLNFSQFREIPLVYNPAMTGQTDNHIRAGFNYRDQWKSFHAPYRTMSAYADGSVNLGDGNKPIKYSDCVYIGRNRFNLGYGLYFISDKAGDGDLKTTSVMASFSLGIHFTDYFYASMGFSGGLGNKSIDFDKLNFMSQWNGSSFNSSLPADLQNVQSSFTYPDLNVGIFLCDSLKNDFTISGGIGVHHLTRPVNGFLNSDDRIPMKINLETWIEKKVHGLSLEFAAYYAFQNEFDDFLSDDDFNELIVGASVNNILLLRGKKFPKPAEAIDLGRMNVHAGLYFRLLPVRDIIPVFGLEKKNLKITFSYDISIMEKYSNYPYRGGFEIALSTKIPTRKVCSYPHLSRD